MMQRNMAYYKSIPDAEEHIKDLETKPYEVCLFPLQSLGTFCYCMRFEDVIYLYVLISYLSFLSY